MAKLTSQESSGAFRLGSDGKLYADHFSGDESIAVQISRHRFVYASRPDQSALWAAIQTQYRAIQAKRVAVQS